MKQFTTPEQTAKLIELGFEKPKGSHSYWRENELVININYTIGELIEMLNRVDDEKLEICRDCGFWFVGTDLYGTLWRELIDALYDMVTLLKEQGVI